MKVVIGSRESKLAVIQSEIVIDAIKKADPSIDVSLVTMKTTGDIILDRTLDKVGGKGLFVKELDQALIDGRADLTVHSLKDMTMEVSQELPLLAFSRREDPRDALVLPEGADDIDFTKPIGCSSKRRILQLRKLFPEARFETIRGNVQTRLRKLDSGEFSATVLACAGLKRLGLEKRISKIFEPGEVLPAACQGILAVQGRKGFEASFLADFNDEESKLRALAERSFVRTLDGGCSSPIAAFAEIDGDHMKLTGFNIDKADNGFTDFIEGPAARGEELGQELALRMKGMVEHI
jgi:hydroxymethylbilane synthase